MGRSRSGRRRSTSASRTTPSPRRVVGRRAYPERRLPCSDTRYIVALDAGGELVVTQQNLVTSSMEALAQQGKAVRLTWKRQHNFPVTD